MDALTRYTVGIFILTALLVIIGAATLIVTLLR